MLLQHKDCNYSSASSKLSYCDPVAREIAHFEKKQPRPNPPSLRNNFITPQNVTFLQSELLECDCTKHCLKLKELINFSFSLKVIIMDSTEAGKKL